MDELDCGFQIIKGQQKTLVVAGHNFQHGRDGKMKFAEWGTGEITRNLCEQFGLWGIVSTKDQMDPNWYTESPFREKIKELVKSNGINLIIDIHGSGMQNDELIYLRGNKKFKERYKIKVRDFVKNEQVTLAEELDNKVAVVEIEIREDGRIPTINVKNYKKAQMIIKNLVQNIYEN